MKIIKKSIFSQITSNYLSDDHLKQSVFFDIETTGLHWKRSHLCVIGILFFDSDTWQQHQIFIESPLEEKAAILYFLEQIQSKETIIHFNGTSFDLPYLIKKCDYYHIEHTLYQYKQMDLYRQLSFMKPMYQLTSLKQKAVENLSGFKRYDQLSGKELINHYKRYIETGEQAELDLILLHNQEDLLGMTAILPLLNIHHDLQTSLLGKIVEDTLKSVSFVSCQPYTFPLDFKFQSDTFILTYQNQFLTLQVSKHSATLKQFFANYKDYYYLPAEDAAIHKSVGQYVDKEYRKKATASTCYQKTTSVFLPVPETFNHLPIFQREYRDTDHYCLYDEHFKQTDICGKYIQTVLNYFISNKKESQF